MRKIVNADGFIFQNNRTFFLRRFFRTRQLATHLIFLLTPSLIVQFYFRLPTHNKKNDGKEKEKCSDFRMLLQRC